MLLSRHFIINEDSVELQGEKLGKGGYGYVVKGRLKSTGQEVAVKLMDVSPNATEPNTTKATRFIRELVVPLTLKLPGIVQLVGFRFPEREPGLAPKPAWIVTELMKNSDVDCQIKKASPEFGPTQKSKVIFGVAVTMMQFHAMNIMHRDLKLANILLDDRYEPHLCDFGLARPMLEGLLVSTGLGSPLYMAPELSDPDSDVVYSFPVDVYAYGVTLWDLFRGNDPFKWEDGRPIGDYRTIPLKVHRGERFERPKNVSERFWSLITRCWSGAAAQRPTFAEIVDMMTRSDDYVVEGTNMDEYREYRRRILDETKRAVEFKFHPMRGHGENGLIISDLAGDNEHLRHWMYASVQKAALADEKDQAYQPYNFFTEPE
jgi:serine/threonine protein kinase